MNYKGVIVIAKKLLEFKLIKFNIKKNTTCAKKSLFKSDAVQK